MSKSNDKTNRFWDAELNEREEDQIREQSVSGELDDPVLGSYFKAMDRLGADDFQPVRSGSHQKTGRSSSRLNRIWTGIALAASLAAAWFVFAPGILPKQTSGDQASQKLSKEELRITREVMQTYSKTLKSGVNTAEIPFKKINEIDVFSVTNSKRK